MIPASRSLDVGQGDGFTVMAWIRPSDINGLHPILQWTDSDNFNLWIGVRPFENGVLRGNIGSVEGNHFVVSHPGVLAGGVFQHIAFTYDKASGDGTLFLNGVIVAQRQLGRQLVAATRGDLWIAIRQKPGQLVNRPGFRGFGGRTGDLQARAFAFGNSGRLQGAKPWRTADVASRFNRLV